MGSRSANRHSRRNLEWPEWLGHLSDVRSVRLQADLEWPEWLAGDPHGDPAQNAEVGRHCVARRDRQRRQTGPGCDHLARLEGDAEPRQLVDQPGEGTARIAQDIGREVFAVPGSPLDPRARGGNELIKQGAMLVETVADVLDNLPMDDAPPLFRTGVAEPPTPWIHPADLTGPPDSVRAEVLGLLSSSPTKVDDLVRRCQFSSSAVMAVLLELELAGRVETLPGSRVALLSEAAS